MDRWVGKAAVVTGSACGIGAATAEGLVKAGVKVIGVDIQIPKVEALKEKLAKEKGELTPYKCDLRDKNQIKELFKFVKEKFGAVHILVNAAGFARYGYICDGNLDHFQEVMDVNVMGSVTCTQEAIKLMKATGVDGHIVFLNSIGGHYVPNCAPGFFNVYSASKFAISGFTESLRQELVHLKSKIKISNISPGSVRTDFFQNFAAGSGLKVEDLDTSWFDNAPAVEPKDIADCILFVLSTPPYVQVHDMMIRPVGEKW